MESIEETFSGKYKTVMFDRFDLYCTQELYDKCVKYSKDMVILFDLKDYHAYCRVAPRPAQVALERCDCCCMKVLAAAILML